MVASQTRPSSAGGVRTRRSLEWGLGEAQPPPQSRPRRSERRLAATWSHAGERPVQERRPAKRLAAADRGPGLMGLANLGNTCFLNSAVQCLLHVPPLMAVFADNASFRPDLATDSRMRGRVARAFAALAHESWRGRQPTVSPGALKRLVSRYAPHFSGFEQQDSQEFLSFVLDGIAQDMRRPRDASSVSDDAPAAEAAWAAHCARNDDVVNDLFAGQLQSVVECQQCRGESFCFDPFLELSVPVPARPRSRSRVRRRLPTARRKQNSWQLSDCLAAFTEEEQLEGVNCALCGGPQNAVKRLTLSRLPRVLVVHIKRFEYTLTRRDKIAAHIDCPAELDMSSYSSSGDAGEECLYDLVAVSNHVGGLAGGHYTASCLSDGRWYSFDDSTVAPLRGPVVTAAAYVLFYVRRSASG